MAVAQWIITPISTATTYICTIRIGYFEVCAIIHDHRTLVRVSASEPHECSDIAAMPTHDWMHQRLLDGVCVDPDVCLYRLHRLQI